MQYALLIYLRPDGGDPVSDDERKALSAEYWAIRDDPRVVGGAALKPVETATTVRVEDGETLVTDGPFADTKEALAGYLVFETDDPEAAVALAARIPAARMGGAVEVRPIADWS